LHIIPVFQICTVLSILFTITHVFKILIYFRVNFPAYSVQDLDQKLLLGVGNKEVIHYPWLELAMLPERGAKPKSFESFNTLWVKLSNSKNIDEE
jgi:hypothetical protein